MLIEPMNNPLDVSPSKGSVRPRSSVGRVSNVSKPSASVSSGVPNTEKQMKARGRRPSAFIVSRCLEPLMKHEARVFCYSFLNELPTFIVIFVLFC